MTDIKGLQLFMIAVLYLVFTLWARIANPKNWLNLVLRWFERVASANILQNLVPKLKKTTQKDD